MNIYLTRLKIFYEDGTLSRKLLVIVLGWLVIYILLSNTIYGWLSTNVEQQALQIIYKDSQIDYLSRQQTQLQAVASSDEYKQWQTQFANLKQWEQKYQSMLNGSGAEQWQDVIKAILQDEKAVNLISIRNTPEAEYPVLSQALNRKIYQQKINLVINADYFNTLRYIEKLERFFINVHWNSMKYEVSSYPLARTELEFMVLYEKNT